MTTASIYFPSNSHSVSDTGHVGDHNNIVNALTVHDNILSYSASLAAAISDDTGSGSLVFNTNPVFAGTASASNLSISGSLTISGNAKLSAASVTSLINTGNATISGTASIVGNTYLSAASVSGSVIATQPWVQSQGYITGATSSIQFTSSSAVTTNTSSTTYVPLAGMASATLLANKTYAYEVMLFVGTSANGQVRFQLNYPSISYGVMNFQQITTAATAMTTAGTSYNIGASPYTVANAVNINTGLVAPVVMKGYLITSASGTLTPTIAVGTAITASAYQGSYMTVTQVA